MVKKIVVCNCNSCDTFQAQEEDAGNDFSYCKPESKTVFKCSRRKCNECFDTLKEAKEHEKECEGG